MPCTLEGLAAARSASQRAARGYIAHVRFSSFGIQEILEGWDLERIEAKVFHHYRKLWSALYMRDAAQRDGQDVMGPFSFCEENGRMRRTMLPWLWKRIGMERRSLGADSMSSAGELGALSGAFEDLFQAVSGPEAEGSPLRVYSDLSVEGSR